jgi:hypothetical protein
MSAFSGRVSMTTGVTKTWKAFPVALAAVILAGITSDSSAPREKAGDSAGTGPLTRRVLAAARDLAQTGCGTLYLSEMSEVAGELPEHLQELEHAVRTGGAYDDYVVAVRLMRQDAALALPIFHELSRDPEPQVRDRARHAIQAVREAMTMDLESCLPSSSEGAGEQEAAPAEARKEGSR